MHCPSCGSEERQQVKETRRTPDGRIVRRRRCPRCREDFHTVEQLADTSLQVRKSDGRIVRFNRNAIRRGLTEAAVRKYDPDRLNLLIDNVVAEIYPQAEDGIVASSLIGAAVLKYFRSFDEVSHIRFALVHMGRLDRTDNRRGWSSVRDFRRWLDSNYPQIRGARVATRLSEVLKRDGTYQRFDRNKLEKGIGVAAKGRGAEGEVERLATDVADDVEKNLSEQPLVTSGQIAAEILRSLRRRDHIAYLRFASTAKHFRSPEDYEAEAEALWRLSDDTIH